MVWLTGLGDLYLSGFVALLALCGGVYDSLGIVPQVWLVFWSLTSCLFSGFHLSILLYSGQPGDLLLKYLSYSRFMETVLN